MTLNDLIAQRDREVEDQAARITKLVAEVGEFMYHAVQTARLNFTRDHDPYFAAHVLFAKPFNWLGMDMWPNSKDDNMRTSFVITLTQAQMDALLLSTFNGLKMGGVRKYNLMYWWKFQPREDGWIELLVEAV